MAAKKSNAKKTPKGYAFVPKSLQAAQAKLVIAKRIMGKSIQDIATDLNCSTDTVSRRIDYAKRNNILSDATDQVLDELVPLAHKAYIAALQQGNLKAAKDVLFGTGILSPNNKAQVSPVTEVAEMTLAVYREQRKAPLAPHIATVVTRPDDPPTLLPAPDLHDAKDGEIVGEKHGEDGLQAEFAFLAPDPQTDPNP